MDYVIMSLLVILLLLLLLTVKNHIVYSNNDKAIDIIYRHKDWRILEVKYAPVNRYEQNLFHPFRWTFESMFPRLQKYKK